MSVEIVVEQVSKRFKRDWIFRNISHSFSQGSKTAVLGQNGSGKSTFLKMVCGYVGLTEGKIHWKANQVSLELEDWHNQFVYCAPYLEILEEFTLQESLDFHFQLTSMRNDIDLTLILDQSGLAKHQNKQVSLFSSGMKQRLKLILALCSEVDVYLLDEPCSNLDDKGYQWYLELIQNLPDNKTLIVASNNPAEYRFCDQRINIEGFK